MNGLELTNLPPRQFSSMQENFVQILHAFENHWTTNSSNTTNTNTNTTIYGLKDLNEIRV